MSCIIHGANARAYMGGQARFNGISACRGVKAGAGERNRTVVISLEGCCSTIELHPQMPISANCQAWSCYRTDPKAASQRALEP